MVVLKDINGDILKVFDDLDTLAGADLSYSDFMFADFRGMDLSDTDFTGAELYGAEFDDDVFNQSLSCLPNFKGTCYELVQRGGGASNSYMEFKG